MDYVQEIARIARIQQAFEQPSEQDWASIESALGLRFPSDYKSLISTIGEGEFGCGLSLGNPRSSNAIGRLSHESLIEYRELIVDLEEKLNLPLYPSKGGHVVIGSIDRQDFLLKPTGRQLEQLVWLDLDLEEVRPLKYSVPHFIHDLYLGLINESWAPELRSYFWRDGDVDFFTARP